VRSCALRKGQLRATPKSRGGRPAVWSAESALLLMVQTPKPRTGRSVLTSQWSGRFAASSMASSSKLSAIDDRSVRPCSISAATSAYGTWATLKWRCSMSGPDPFADFSASIAVAAGGPTSGFRFSVHTTPNCHPMQGPMSASDPKRTFSECLARRDATGPPQPSRFSVESNDCDCSHETERGKRRSSKECGGRAN
jgi:hypothetical protein